MIDGKEVENKDFDDNPFDVGEGSGAVFRKESGSGERMVASEGYEERVLIAFEVCFFRDI